MSRFVTYPKAAEADATIRRFEPSHWLVDFPLSMMATLVTAGPNALTVHALFRREGDLMGLIWETEDRRDAGTFAYPRRKDYRGTVLEFDWVSTGIRALDLTQGPTLAVETFAGATHQVRLWNYATSGTPTNCHIRLELSAVLGGFDVSGDLGEAIDWSDVKRLFISLIPPGYVEDSATQIGEAGGRLELTNIAVTGPGSTLPVRTAPLPAHDLKMTDGFDNAYPFAPERLVEQVHRLGYRDFYVLYLGISKFHALSWNAGEGRYVVDPGKPALNAPTVAWLTDFFARLHAKGYTVIVSVSFEILGEYLPDAWNQRDHAGNLARSGWVPPSGFVRPTSAEGLDYLATVFLAALALLPAGAEKHFQIGEPTWWEGSFGAGVNAPHIYDADTLAQYAAETGLFAPTPWLSTVLEQPDPVHLPFVAWCRDQLGEATHFLRDRVLAAYPGATSFLLLFPPQILRDGAPLLYALNFARAWWSEGEWDVLMIEDYDWISAGRRWDMRKTWLLATRVLGFPLARIHYFAGFNLLPATTWIWRETDLAIMDAFARGPAAVYVWSREQVQRDGWLFDQRDWKLFARDTRLATCWRIARADGVVEAYTSFDRPLTIPEAGGADLTYSPANGFSASQLASDAEMSVADVEVLGAIDADAISAEALLAGVYDDAEVEMVLVDWADPAIPPTILRRGTIGTISQSGGGFTAELRGLAQKIQQPVIDVYQPECRVDLYSPPCGVDRAAFAVPAAVTALTDGALGVGSDNRTFYAAALGQADGWFDYAELWWTGGANAGLKTEVRRFAETKVELWEPMGFAVALGDTFTIHAGCDKQLATCIAKFANVLNFRGEPFVPGQDDVLAYPDAVA